MIMHPGIKLRHVRAFLEIASAGSLTAVARAQGVTQPALSRSLAELETLLATRMFHREGRRLVLTEAGQLFRHHARLGVQALDQAAAVLRPDARGGTLGVGVQPTAATRLFPAVALQFHDLHPDTVLSVTSGPQSYLLHLLREGALDLLIGRMPAASDMAGLSFDHLYEEDVVLTARAGHPLRAAPVADVLGQCRLILPPEGANIRRVVEDYLASLDLARLRPAFETVVHALGRGLVLGSDAVWFISRGVIVDDVARGDMIILPTDARSLWGAVGLTRRQGMPDRAEVEALIRITRQCVAQIQAEGRG